MGNLTFIYQPDRQNCGKILASKETIPRPTFEEWVYLASKTFCILPKNITLRPSIFYHIHIILNGYSFAIVGINLTAMAYRLLTDECAKTHIFNVCASSPVETERKPILKHFHHFYAYLFVEFDKFWLAEKPRDVMEFNRIRDLFENQIRTMLADRNCHFKINITVENV